MTNNDDIKVTKGSSNVFSDLGLDNADELLTRAELGRKIRQIISERGYKQKEAATVLGSDQPEISKLVNGHTHLFSVERLMEFLNRLDFDIQIVIKPAESKNDASLQVVYT
jgi:predicted XRE-type DNA-binding protein